MNLLRILLDFVYHPMLKKVKNYFLERFRQKNKTELQKAFYLLLSTFTVLGFFCFLLLSHILFWPGAIYLAGDLLGIMGCLLALYQFRLGHLEDAGKMLIGFIIIVCAIHSVVADYFRVQSPMIVTYIDQGRTFTHAFRVDPAIRFRLYVTFVSILSCFFLFMSFFRNIRQLVAFTVLFIGVLTAHFIVILMQIGEDSKMAYFALQHYITVSVGTIAAALISGLLITLIERLYSQALRQGEVISRQNEELQATVDESLKEFAYLTSHDLREPLRSISGFITLIAKQCESVEMPAGTRKEVHEYFDYVHKGVRQMEELITDIKEYSSINVLEKNFSAIATKDLFLQVCDTLDSDISKSHATINIPKLLPEINGDKTLLHSLIQHLISNAIKYQKPGMAPIITVSYSHTDRGHVLGIQDNGIGVPDEYRERIFHAFKRLHGKDSAYTGTGMGLAICKKVIEIHGGDIWLESTPGIGSTFYFSLRDDL
jgi:signal transduction histidine kinase